MEYKRIKSISALKKAATNKDGNYWEFCIVLGPKSILRSTLEIIYFPKTKRFYVNNNIDGTSQDGLTEKQLKSKTLIYYAIKAGAFYQSIF